MIQGNNLIYWIIPKMNETGQGKQIINLANLGEPCTYFRERQQFYLKDDIISIFSIYLFFVKFQLYCRQIL